jgi:hypothetical protein
MGLPRRLSKKDPFYSAKIRFKQAERNLPKIARLADRFIADNQNARAAVELNPKTRGQILKVKFRRRIPSKLEVLVTETVEHLRHALDIACHATAARPDNPSPRYTYFPIADNPTELDRVIKGRSKGLHPEIVALIRKFEPDKTRNLLLWAVNQAANRKHIALMPVGGAGGFHGGIAVRRGTFKLYPDIRWDRAKNEIAIGELSQGGEADYNFGLTFSVAFSEIDGLREQQVVRKLYEMICMVGVVLGAIEAEARRLGLPA